MRRQPLNGDAAGLTLAAIGALVLTPDSLMMRWSGMEAFPMLAWRGLTAGAVMLLVWLATRAMRHRGAVLAALGRDLTALACPAGLFVVCALALSATLFSYGVANGPVAVLLFGISTAPVFSAVAAYVIAGERTDAATWWATAAVLTGIAIAVFGDGGPDIGPSAPAIIGALCGLGVAGVIGVKFVAYRAYPALPVLPAIGFGALLAGCVGLIGAGGGALTEGLIWPVLIAAILILPVSSTLLSLAARRTHAANVSLLMLLETVLGPAWVWLGTDERPTAATLMGGAVVVASLALFIEHQRRRVRRAP